MYQILELYKKEVNKIFIKYLNQTTFITSDLTDEQAEKVQSLIKNFETEIDKVTDLYLKLMPQKELFSINNYRTTICSCFINLIN